MKRTRTERGTIYLLVLVSSVIVTLIGLMGFRMIRAQAAIAQSDTQRDEAVVIAESAVQWGIHIVTLKDDWRDDITSGVPIRTGPFGQGTMSVMITDVDDGDLADDTTDPFTIRGTGIVGDSTQMLELVVQPPVAEVHPALTRSLTVWWEVDNVKSSYFTLEDGGLARNVTGSTDAVFSEIETTHPVPIPDASVIDTWAALGTVVPRSVHGEKLTGITLSTTSAPPGITPDPNGIYVIDCEKKQFEIESCTVEGTLVVINTRGSGIVSTDTRYNFGPNGGPTLLVDGNVEFSGAVMDTGVHQGLIYVNGDLNMASDTMFVGTIMVYGDLKVDSYMFSVSAHPSATDGPPTGFGTEGSNYAIDPGSWSRVVN
ncbi:MAG: hypothetical protein Phyf2KO_02310 [Phycisphaerales bacterium]